MGPKAKPNDEATADAERLESPPTSVVMREEIEVSNFGPMPNLSNLPKLRIKDVKIT